MFFVEGVFKVETEKLDSPETGDLAHNLDTYIIYIYIIYTYIIHTHIT